MNNKAYKELHHAAIKGDVKKVEECLSEGINPDIEDEQGRTALMLSRKLEFKIVDALLDAGADPNARDENGDTPLHYNCREGDYYKYERLRNHGADLLAVNNNGVSPLEMILEKEAIKYPELIRMTRGAKNFTLERASGVIKNREYLARLKMHGLWLTKSQKERGRRLHRAIKKSDPAAVRSILDEGPLVEILDKYRCSFLFSAVHCKGAAACEIVEQLLAAGASKDIRSNPPRTPLEEALIFVRSDIVSLLEPGYPIPETVQKGITHITIMETQNYGITLYPNKPGVGVSSYTNVPRGKEAAGESSAAEVVQSNPEMFHQSGNSWLFSFLKRYADGEPVCVEEIGKACLQETGREIILHRIDD